ncbi:hypothetical protein WJX77_008788 [Trebouxia sp. C0004]
MIELSAQAIKRARSGLRQSARKPSASGTARGSVLAIWSFFEAAAAKRCRHSGSEVPALADLFPRRSKGHHWGCTEKWYSIRDALQFSQYSWTLSISRRTGAAAMSSVLAPSFLLELGAYAVAAAGIRLFRNRSSRARQQEAQEHPEIVYQHKSPRVVGLSQASPLLSTCRSRSRSPQPCPDGEVQSPQAAGFFCKDEAKGNMSDGGTSAQKDTGVPSSNAAYHNRAASGASAEAAEGEQQQLQDMKSKDEQQALSSGPHRAHAIWPQNVNLAHRGADASSAGDSERTSGPSQHSVSEDDPKVDIVTRDEPPEHHNMAVDDPSNGGNDVISDSETSKHEEEEVACGMKWAWGADTLDDQCDNVDQDRSLLLTAIQKHKRSAQRELESSEIQLFVSNKRTCGPLIGGAEEEVKGSAEPATGDSAVPGDGMTGEASDAQPNDLLQEIASVTLRLLAGPLRYSPASKAAQPDPSPFSQALAEQSPGSDFSNPTPSQAGQTLADPGIEEEEGHLAEDSQQNSAGMCVEGMPMLEEESEQAHQHSAISSGQPSHSRSANPDSLTEAEVCSQGAFGQPDQAMELEHATEEEDQDSIQECNQIHDSHSGDAEATEHSEVADESHPGGALKDVRMPSEWKRWLYSACGASLPLPAAHVPHLPQHDAMTCPDSSPPAQTPRATSLEADADMEADDSMHGQISLSASDSAANAPLASVPSESPANHALARGAAGISAPGASGAPAADTLHPANIVETKFAAPSGHCEGHEQADLEGYDELCQAVNLPAVHPAQRAEETEESRDEAPASKAGKYPPGEHHHRAESGSRWGIATQPTLDLPGPSRFAGSCFSKSAEAKLRGTRGGSYHPNLCHESDYLFHDSPDQHQPQSVQQLEQQQSSGLLNKLPDHLNEVCNPDVHELQHGELEQASPGLSDDYESRAVDAEHPGADAQTDGGRQLPMVDSAPPIASNSPPGSPTSSSAWGSPGELAVNSPAGSLAHSHSPEWGSVRGAFSKSPRYRAVPASPAAQSPAWGSPLRASRSRSLRHVSPSKSPAWQSPGRAARDSLDCHSPVSPGAPPATLPHAHTCTHTHHSQPTRWSKSPDYVPPFWSLPKSVSASAARAAGDSPDYWQSLKEAEDRLGEPAMSPRYLPSGGGIEEEDQQMYAEPDHEEEDNGMAAMQQGHKEEGDEPDACKYEAAYRARVCKSVQDYVNDAWDLSESSEDGEDNAPARADVECEEEDDEFQVRGSTHSDSAEQDEGMHGTRAAAGSSPGQAPSPGPDKVLPLDEGQDCMLEEEDCKEKHLAAAHESVELLTEEDMNIDDDDDDDDVQLMGETGPDPSKSAFQQARKRLASIRASQRSGEEEDDVELYPGVQDLISGTLLSGRNTVHHVRDFAAELSKGSSILRHFKRLRKLPSATRTSELSQRAEATAQAGRDPDPTLSGSLKGGLEDSKEDQADRSSGELL